MSAEVVIVVLLVVLVAQICWTEYYRRIANRLQRDNDDLRAMLDYRKK